MQVRIDAILPGLTLRQAEALVDNLATENAREALVRLALSRHSYELAKKHRDRMRDPLGLDRRLLKDYVWYPWVRR